MFVVAGVTGHVGSVVAEELLAKGEKVKVIVRDAAKGLAWSGRGAEVAVGVLEDAAFLAGALRGAAGFFTLLPPNYGATDFFASQRRTADAIAEAVKKSGVPHVVMLSSVGADLESGTGPIRGLHYLEKALRSVGMTLTAIRAGYFQENVANSLDAAKQAGIFPNFTPSADDPSPMIATRDIGLLAARTLVERPASGAVIDLLGPAYSVRQQAALLGAALGKTLQVIDIPPEGHVAALTQAGMPPHLAEVFAEMYAGFASGRIRPIGDRLVEGTTRLEDTIKSLV